MDSAVTIYEALRHVISEFDDAEAVAAVERFAARFGSLRTVGLDDQGLSLLYWAAFADRLPVARALVHAGITLDAEADAVVDPGERDTAVHAAAERGSLYMLELLLGAGGRRLINVFDAVERTPLHIAVERGFVPLARILIDAGADPNAQDEPRIGNPPLRRVFGIPDPARRTEMVKLLLAAGADPTRRGWMCITPIDDAALAGEEGKELLDLYRQHLGWSESQLAAFLAPPAQKPRPSPRDA